ncbi:FMRFamide receptor-like [Scylla paramamosain]|uniref:FMRFamide receptor-like n=1 Tax=Scylla paramamosain TaxID=85552 RepID=UPI0030829738
MDLLEDFSSGGGGGGGGGSGDMKNFSSLFLDVNSSYFLFPYNSNGSLYQLDYDYAAEGHNASLQHFPALREFANATSPSDTSSFASNASLLATSSNYAPYERFMDESRHWVQKVLVPLVMCVGVVGNSVSMVVLTRRKMRSSTNNYLTALAISDLLYLVFVFSLSLQHHPNIKHPRHWFYWQYFRYALWLTDASSSTSIWLTVTFTIERYIAISHPIKGKMLCTVSRAKKVVAVVYFLCFALTATTPHEWVVVTRHETDTKEPYLSLDYSSLGQDSTYRHTYYWFTAVTFILLPLCLLAVFNFFLIQAVRMSKLTRRKMTLVSERDHYSHQQEHKITVMLIAVVILALVCQMPTAVLLLYSTVCEPLPRTKEFAVMRGLGNIFNLLNAINAAANFILYCSFSDKYRKTFLVTFVPCMYHQQPLAHSFVASVNDTTVGNTRIGRSSDSYSVRSVSRRVSKASSTPSPMPPRDAPNRTARGSFRGENGVGSLDTRVTLQYGFGRPSHLLSPPDPHAHHNSSHTLDLDNAHYSPVARSKHNPRGSRYGGKWSPEGGSPATPNHCQGPVEVTKVDLEMRPRAAEGLGRLLAGTDEAGTGGRADRASLSSGENSPLELRFIDEESCDTCRSSPTSNTRLEEEGEGVSEGRLATRDTLSSLAPLTPDAAQDSDIHSPD